MMDQEKELIAERQFVKGISTATVLLSVDNTSSDTFRVSGSTEIHVNQSRSVMGFLLMDRDISKRTGYIREVVT